VKNHRLVTDRQLSAECEVRAQRISESSENKQNGRVSVCTRFVRSHVSFVYANTYHTNPVVCQIIIIIVMFSYCKLKGRARTMHFRFLLLNASHTRRANAAAARTCNCDPHNIYTLLISRSAADMSRRCYSSLYNETRRYCLSYTYSHSKYTRVCVCVCMDVDVRFGSNPQFLRYGVFGIAG